jgi:hypothetical protein
MARMLVRGNDGTKDEGYYLNDSGFDRDTDPDSLDKGRKEGFREQVEWEGLEHVPYTSRVTPDTTTKVTKNLR